MPRVSVVMSFFNESAFIAEAIESVLAQTYSDWELILVDDGSTDGSSAIARAFTARHPDRLRYFDHPGHANRGTSASRNCGIAHSGGEFIAFLDSDDVYLPQRLALHMSLLEFRPDIDMVQSNTLRWYTWGSSGLPDIVGTVPAIAGGIAPPGAMLRDSLRQDPESGWFPCTCSVTLRRSVVIKVGGFEEEFLTLCEDWAFWQKIYLHGNIRVTEDVVARYRKHSGSVLHRAADDRKSILGERYHAHLAYLRWLERYLTRHGADRKTMALVHRRLWPEGSSFFRETLGLPPALGLTVRTATGRIRGRARKAARDAVRQIGSALQGSRPSGTGARGRR